MARKRKMCKEGDTCPAKKRRKVNPNDKPDVDDEEDPDNFTTIKCCFKSIVKKRYQELLTHIFYQRSFEMTKTSSLASLLLLYKVNQAVDTNNDDFFNQDGAKLIRDTFDEVLAENFNNPEKPQMPPEFRQWVHQEIADPNFVWPSGKILARSLWYFKTTYITSVKNNMVVHCQTRIKYFLRMQCFKMNLEIPDDPNIPDNKANPNKYNEIDVRNTIKALFNNQDWTEGNADRQRKRDILWRKVIDLGFSEDWTYLKAYVKYNWFYSMRIFAKIQREVEEFLTRYRYLIDLWGAWDACHHRNKKRKNKPPAVLKNPQRYRI